MALELFGSLTSPYVRRVRIVASELGVETDFVDVTTTEGQAALRRCNPLWKVPTARLDGQELFDSAVIIRTLIERFGPGPLTPQASSNLDLINFVTVVDGALDSLINAFYLGKDGVTADEGGYVHKQGQRAAAAMTWVEQRMTGGRWDEPDSFGLPEIALVTSVGWMRLRNAYPIDRHPRIVAACERHAERPSVAQSRPPA